MGTKRCGRWCPRRSALHTAVFHVLGDALKRVPDDAHDGIRSQYVLALYKLGRWEMAYAEIEPHDETFTQLASLMTNDKKAAELEALIGVHRPHARAPEGAALLSWDLEVLGLKQDYEGVLRFLTEHGKDALGQSSCRWKGEEYRVRCLVRLKRGDEAVRAAEEIVKKNRAADRLLLVLAHAARGDVAQAIAAMGKLGKTAYFVRRCYDDADLGPLVQSEPFQAFRKQFPRP